MDLFNDTRRTTDGIRVGDRWLDLCAVARQLYPKGLVQRRELEYASRHVGAIEINGTYYSAQKPATYAKWRDEAPDGFVFSAERRCDRAVAPAGGTRPQVEDFVGGIAELGAKLGPIVWQFDAGIRLDRDAFATFCALLPAQAGGQPTAPRAGRARPAFVVSTSHWRGGTASPRCTPIRRTIPRSPMSADFVYARLMRTRADIATGYPDDELAAWRHAHACGGRRRTDHLPKLEAVPAPAMPREVFVCFISAARRATRPPRWR